MHRQKAEGYGGLRVYDVFKQGPYTRCYCYNVELQHQQFKKAHHASPWSRRRCGCVGSLVSAGYQAVYRHYMSVCTRLPLVLLRVGGFRYLQYLELVLLHRCFCHPSDSFQTATCKCIVNSLHSTCFCCYPYCMCSAMK